MGDAPTLARIHRGNKRLITNGRGDAIPEEICEAARNVVIHMSERTKFRLDILETLVDLAERLGCDVVFKRRGSNSYTPNDDELGMGGIICINGKESRPFQTRRLAHELTHHLVYWRSWIIRAEWENYLALYPGGRSPKAFEERVCRVVEDMVLILPNGLQWDGRLSVPRGDGTVRMFPMLAGANNPLFKMKNEEIEQLLLDLDREP